VSPPPGTRHDWDLLLDLAARVLKRRGIGGALAARALSAVVGRLGLRGLIDVYLRTGPHRRRGLTVSRLLRDHSHGVDLGALRPRLPGRLCTPSGRIRLVPDVLVADLARLEAKHAPGVIETRDLLLIGRRDLRSNNSWMHNSKRLVKGDERCTLVVHPDDAKARGLVAGARAVVESRVGRVVVPVDVSDEIMRGVVSLPHGWGHDDPGAALGVAAAHAGVSANALTDDALIDAPSGTGALNGVPVSVAAATAS
jgi:anaerobic selenocysteine-containing dehydrogenase